MGVTLRGIEPSQSKQFMDNSPWYVIARIDIRNLKLIETKIVLIAKNTLFMESFPAEDG